MPPSASSVSGVNRSTDGLALTAIWSVVFAFEANLPPTIVEDYKVLCARHAELHFI